jgi:hypothetical protein
MSLEAAGEFVLDFLKDVDATSQADAAYLDAVARIAKGQGHDLSPGEISEAMRAIAGLDADVEGFRDGLITITDSTISGNTANRPGDPNSPLAATVTIAAQPMTFSPLGFMR